MRLAALVLTTIAAAASPVFAQLPKPLPVGVIDLRGFTTSFGQDAATAQDLAVSKTAMPKHGVGGVLGIHLYLLRAHKVALGIGGEGVLARASATPKDSAGVPTGVTIHQELQGLSGVLSLNFGHRDGWSYVSAGMGPLLFASYQGVKPVDRPPVQNTISLGAGARWFASRHVAFCFDLHFYQTRPEVLTEYAGRQRAQLKVWSAGIAVR
jgi:hypothetical protein